MSLDLFVSCFRHGELHPQPSALLRAPFEPLVVSSGPGCLVLGLPGGQESLLFIDTNTDTGNGFALNRPVHNPRCGRRCSVRCSPPATCCWCRARCRR